MSKSATHATLDLGNTAFEAGIYHFGRAYELMKEYPNLALVVSIGDMERVVLQQRNKPDKKITIDRLSPVNKDDSVVLKIELDDEFVECVAQNKDKVTIHEKTVTRSYIATNDSHGSVTELVELEEKLHSRMLRLGEKRDLFREIADASLCQVD